MSVVNPGEYPIQASESERLRLMRQARLWRPMTERLLRSAGIGPGASVVDIGCGAGDTTLLAAELVGPSGRVIGLDINPSQIAFCKARTDAAGLSNVAFEVGSFTTDCGHKEWDAVIGRFVLMYQNDPVSCVAAASNWLRSRGVCAFLEANICDAVLSLSTHPRPSAAQRAFSAGTAALAARVQPMMGLKLRATLQAAGLDVSECVFEAGAPLLFREQVQESAANSSHFLARLAIADGLLESNEFDPSEETRWASTLSSDFACVNGPLSVCGWGRMT